VSPSCWRAHAVTVTLLWRVRRLVIASSSCLCSYQDRFLLKRFGFGELVWTHVHGWEGWLAGCTQKYSHLSRLFSGNMMMVVPTQNDYLGGLDLRGQMARLELTSIPNGTLHVFRHVVPNLGLSFGIWHLLTARLTNKSFTIIPALLVSRSQLSTFCSNAALELRVAA